MCRISITVITSLYHAHCFILQKYIKEKILTYATCLSSCHVRCFWSWVHCFRFAKFTSIKVHAIKGEVNDKLLIFQKDMLRNWGSFQHFGPVCASFLWSSLFYRNDKCIFSLWRILSASGMKLPRAAWGLVFHWSFNNKSMGFVNKGLQTSAEFFKKPVEGAEGLEDLGRSAGVCVSKMYRKSQTFQTTETCCPWIS